MLSWFSTASDILTILVFLAHISHWSTMELTFETFCFVFYYIARTMELTVEN
jgi:hypothetical protein